MQIQKPLAHTQRSGGISNARTNKAIARRRNETDETEVLTRGGSLPANVEVELRILKTATKPLVTMKE
jgi:hypothetical protein